MLVLIAVCLPLCVIMAAFAVDVAWMQLVRTELRTATDAAARAGAKELSLSQDTNAARDRAKQAARRNKVAGEPLLLADSDIQIGSSTQPSAASRFTFSSGGAQPNAVRVTGRARTVRPPARWICCLPAYWACASSSRSKWPPPRNWTATFAWWSIVRAR